MPAPLRRPASVSIANWRALKLVKQAGVGNQQLLRRSPPGWTGLASGRRETPIRPS